MNKLAAIILAAGFSSRMGDFKPLLPLGNQSVIEQVTGAFFQAGINDVRVVVGYNASRLIPLLEELNVKALYNDDFEEGMFTSVQTGARSLKLNPADGFFLMPVDYPLVRPMTISKLAHTYCSSEAKIVYPSYDKRKGHPPVISPDLIDDILQFEGAGGLRGLLSQYEGDALYLTVEDETVLMDMDTKKDYDKILNFISQ